MYQRCDETQRQDTDRIRRSGVLPSSAMGTSNAYSPCLEGYQRSESSVDVMAKSLDKLIANASAPLAERIRTFNARPTRAEQSRRAGRSAKSQSHRPTSRFAQHHNLARHEDYRVAITEPFFSISSR